MKNKLKIVSALVTVFITAPIWYYVLWWMLSQLDAPSLVWFLFWVYVPFGMFAQSVTTYLNNNKESV